MKKSKKEWIDNYLELLEQYFEETGVKENGKRIVCADLLNFQKWLLSKLYPTKPKPIK